MSVSRPRARHTRRVHLPSPGTILGGLALVLVIAGGSAYAGGQLARNSVKAKHIAKNAVTNKHTRHLTVLPPKNVKAYAGPVVDAPEVNLLRRGPFRIYAKCYTGGAGVNAQVFMANKRDGVVGRVGASVYEGDATGYAPKSDAIVLGAIMSAPEGQATQTARSVSLVHGTTTFRASVEAWLKGGSLVNGDGTYGPGKRCLFIANESGTG